MRNLCFGTPNYYYPYLKSGHKSSIDFVLRHSVANVSTSRTAVSYAFVPDSAVWEMMSYVVLRFLDIRFYHLDYLQLETNAMNTPYLLGPLVHTYRRI